MICSMIWNLTNLYITLQVSCEWYFCRRVISKVASHFCTVHGEVDPVVELHSVFNPGREVGVRSYSLDTAHASTFLYASSVSSVRAELRKADYVKHRP